MEDKPTKDLKPDINIVEAERIANCQEHVNKIQILLHDLHAELAALYKCSSKLLSRKARKRFRKIASKQHRIHSAMSWFLEKYFEKFGIEPKAGGS